MDEAQPPQLVEQRKVSGDRFKSIDNKKNRELKGKVGSSTPKDTKAKYDKRLTDMVDSDFPGDSLA